MLHTNRKPEDKRLGLPAKTILKRHYKIAPPPAPARAAAINLRSSATSCGQLMTNLFIAHLVASYCGLVVKMLYEPPLDTHQSTDDVNSLPPLTKSIVLSAVASAGAVLVDVEREFT